MTTRRRLLALGDAAVGRLWRTRADLRRRRSGTDRTRDSLASLGGLDDDVRQDVLSWNAATAAAHDTYRSQQTIPAGDVAIICSSNRPADLANVAEMVGRQRLDGLELVFVAHGDDFDPASAREAFQPLDGRLSRVRVLHRPTSASLGECLNHAMAHTNARFVAKFDSDDRYGAEYLADSLRAHSYADAALVGKHSYYAYIESTGEYVLRYPGNEFRPTSTLAGSTFVIDRNQTDDLEFEAISLGEDRAFIRACHRRGLTVFAADRFNHVLVRTGANTWQLDRAAVLAKSNLLDGDAETLGIER